jgi:hypothetical protein
VRSTWSSAERIRAAWVALIVALLCVLALWSTSISTSLGDSEPAITIPSPPPVREVATVITVYPDPGAVEPDNLCAEVTPQFNYVIADTNLGYILAGIRC